MSSPPKMCVIIPVHRPVIQVGELASLRACQANLSAYDCYLVFPAGMDVTAYTSIFKGLLLQPVNPVWLSSVQKYNKMKLDVRFYQLFGSYQFMLTYELDAYIFNADFESVNVWDVDFIGAPFLEGYWDATPASPFIKGCNSGFSIRNIQSCMRVLKSMKIYWLPWVLQRVLLSRFPALRLKINRITNYKYEALVNGDACFHFTDSHLNEDLVWTRIVPQLFRSFTIADSLTAVKFSFEYCPAKMLEINGGRLPLGCHAWYKEYDFWKKYINVEQPV